MLEQAKAREKNIDSQNVQAPATLIQVTQQVGRELGISQDKLTKERPEADPSSSDATSNDD
jgi:hypothetical protein